MNTFLVHFRLFTLFKRTIVRSVFRSFFWKERPKEQSHNRSFEKNDKRAITQLLLRKEQHTERSHNLSFEKSDQKSDRTIALLKRATKRAITQSLFWKEQKKSDCTIALLKRATKRAITQSLFWKEQQKEQSHNRSFEKSGHNCFLEKSEKVRWVKERMCDCPTLVWHKPKYTIRAKFGDLAYNQYLPSIIIWKYHMQVPLFYFIFKNCNCICEKHVCKQQREHYYLMQIFLDNNPEVPSHRMVNKRMRTQNPGTVLEFQHLTRDDL